LGAYLDVRDGTHDSPIYVEKGYPFVTSKNLINGAIDFSTCKQISKKDFEKFDSRSHVDNGDILYAMIGSIGNAVIVNKDREFAIKNIALFKKHNILLTNMSFVYYWLCFIEKSLKNNAAGALQPFISLSNFRIQVFPLPPLKEQEEIVNKVEHLLAKVTELENQIAERENMAKQLMQSILKDAFGEKE
jgi:type I restriction enzyme S subunit